MKHFIEFIPIALFVGVYFYYRDIFIATAVLMSGVLLQVVFEFATTRTVAKRTWYIFGIVEVLGSLTLIFQNPVFVQWKPTIVNWVFSIGLLGNLFLSKNSLLKQMLGEQLELPDNVWKNLTLGWSAGFFLAGAVNLVVAFNFSMDIWVSYKFIGGIALTFSYIIITVIYLARGGYLQEPDSDQNTVDADGNQNPNV